MPDTIDYIADQQSTARDEIILLLPRIKDASAVQDILLAMHKTFWAQSYNAGDDMNIISYAIRDCVQEIRDQLEPTDPDDAKATLAAHNRERAEDMNSA